MDPYVDGTLLQRRTLFLASSMGMMICYVVCTILSARFAYTNFTDTQLANAVLVFIFLFYFAYNAGANILPFLYLSEVLPYSHRAKGFNIFKYSIIYSLFTMDLLTQWLWMPFNGNITLSIAAFL